MSLRKYARLVKRAGRIIAGRDVLYKYDIKPRKISLGTDYGGWTLVGDNLGNSSTIYSSGVGNDISFDIAAIERFGCKVHGFDPSPPVAEWIKSQKLPPNYIFHP